MLVLNYEVRKYEHVFTEVDKSKYWKMSFFCQLTNNKTVFEHTFPLIGTNSWDLEIVTLLFFLQLLCLCSSSWTVSVVIFLQCVSPVFAHSIQMQ